LRTALYSRLCGHYQFINELMLFADIHDLVKYSVNIYHCSSVGAPSFSHMSSLYHPFTIDSSYVHDGLGSIPGIKTDDDKWDTRPHCRRIIPIDRERLVLFARLYDSAGTPAEQARLPVVHSQEIVRVLAKVAEQAHRLGDFSESYYASVMFDENQAQQKGVIRKESRYPSDVTELIVSGPHFHVATPLNKSPNQGCSHNLDYSGIDLISIAPEYLPRTNFVPASSLVEFRKRLPTWNEKPATEYYRYVHRRQLSATGERTLICAIIPPGSPHVNTVVSAAFSDHRLLLLFSSLASSIVYDFYVKSTGRGDLYPEQLELLPIPKSPGAARFLYGRTLRLNCLTTHYALLWQSALPDAASEDGFTKVDPRLTWPSASADWNATVALRPDYARRQALVELDALAAIALNLTEEELITIYRVQFPVLRQYERENLYDQTGRLLPKGVLDLAKRHNIDIRHSLNVSAFTGPADLVGEVETPGLGVTGGIVWEDPKMEPRMKRVYPPPFTRCDREADMRQAYRAFQERLRSQEDAP
jgi:hypothetical protein